MTSTTVRTSQTFHSVSVGEASGDVQLMENASKTLKSVTATKRVVTVCNVQMKMKVFATAFGSVHLGHPKGKVFACLIYTMCQTMPGKDGFSCTLSLSGQCVPDHWLCDGKPDLINGLDEQNCNQRTCQSGYQNCDNNKCAPPAQLCDGTLNCIDGRDEANCRDCYKTCDGTCITHSQVCDGNFNCMDKSDEVNCESWQCSEGFWKCTDGKCIKQSHVCDLLPDCADESDEKHCANWSCAAGFWKCADQVQCIPFDKVCDHIVTCQDASDEPDELCDSSWNCSADMWKCTKRHTQCLSPKYVCDGKDFPQGCFHGDQDEENCEHWNCTEGHWKCGDNLQCIPFSQVCDGEDHCNDKSDEKGCERLTCPENEWTCLSTRNCIQTSQVCDGLFDCPNESDEKGENISQILLLSKVPNNEFVVFLAICVFVDCQSPDFSCPAGFWKCRNGRCIMESQVCDGTFHCGDESDEENCINWACVEGFIKCADQMECVKVM